MESHFDELEDYDSEIPEHIRTYLLERKLGLQLQYTDEHFKRRDLKVLDIGSGTGWHVRKMLELGFDAQGIDESKRQCDVARTNSGNAARINQGSVLKLPFDNNSFDVIYTINTLHHLPDRGQQQTAMKEIERVLKPNGLLFIHEINPLNPLVRFYMDYVFPKLRGIDDGTEQWLTVKIIKELSSELSVVGENYYTFIPDFLPKCLMKSGMVVERILEKSPIRRYSGHFTCVSRKNG